MNRHVVIIGAGIVGLSCAERLLGAGLDVTVVDRDPDGDKCSLGNAGGIAVTEVVPASVPGLAWKVPGWLADPLGPLFIGWGHAPRMLPWLAAFLKAGRPAEVRRISGALAALNALVYDDFMPLMGRLGLSGDVHRVGAVTVYSDSAALQDDRWAWTMRRDAGITCQELSTNELRAMEPELAPGFRRAVYTPGWSHVADPKRIVQRLLARLRERGATIVPGEVAGFVPAGRGVSAVCLRDGRTLQGDDFVLAGGAWSAKLAARLGDRVLLESERGYNTSVPSAGIAVAHEIIFAEQKFVVTPLEGVLRVGGAAEFTGLAARPNFRRCGALLELGRRAIPKLAGRTGVDWMGQRPTTPDSLPVIGPSRQAANVSYAFGHGHLGLTQAATTARLIGELLTNAAPSIDLKPFSAQRF